MVKFTEDLYYRPEMLERVLSKLTDEFITFGIDLCKGLGVKIMKIAEERAGAFFYPLRIFDKFWWRYTTRIVDAYCQRLIDEDGNDGGHILSTACSLPAAALNENFRAFLETGKTYELSR